MEETKNEYTDCETGGSSRAVVLVNQDLKIAPGLMAAQVAHVILKMSKDTVYTEL